MRGEGRSALDLCINLQFEKEYEYKQNLKNCCAQFLIIIFNKLKVIGRAIT